MNSAHHGHVCRHPPLAAPDHPAPGRGAVRGDRGWPHRHRRHARRGPPARPARRQPARRRARRGRQGERRLEAPLAGAARPRRAPGAARAGARPSDRRHAAGWRRVAPCPGIRAHRWRRSPVPRPRPAARARHVGDVRGARVTCGGGVGGGPGGPGCGQVECGLHRVRCPRSGDGPAVCRRPRRRHRPRPSTGRRLAAVRGAPPAGRHRGCASRRRAARRRRPRCVRACGASTCTAATATRPGRPSWPRWRSFPATRSGRDTAGSGPAPDAGARPCSPGRAGAGAARRAARSRRCWLARWPVSDRRPEWPSR